MSEFHINCKKVAELPSELQDQYADFGNGYTTRESLRLFESVQDEQLLMDISLREAQKMAPLDVLHGLAISGSEATISEASPDRLFYLENPLTSAASWNARLQTVIQRAKASLKPEQVEQMRKIIDAKLAQNLDEDE